MQPGLDSRPLDQVRLVSDLRRRVREWKLQGRRVGLVPTMGALHEGHLSLIRQAADEADRVVASIFVNPTQFGPDEDFGRYPRRPQEDAALLAANGCDLLFLPEVETVYPPGHVTFVELDESLDSPSSGLESEFRPGHFRGVVTVVAQLFNLVEPDLAVFGEKDAQQLATVRRMVHDLHFAVEILAHPTVREADGLAMSSRNAFLTPQQRAAAPRLYQMLRRAARMIEAGERDASVVRQAMRKALAAEPLFETNYADVVDADNFQRLDHIGSDVILPAAVDLGGTRLLDNVRVAIST